MREGPSQPRPEVPAFLARVRGSRWAPVQRVPAPESPGWSPDRLFRLPVGPAPAEPAPVRGFGRVPGELPAMRTGGNFPFPPFAVAGSTRMAGCPL